ncbi:MAG: S41 family peptidase, partial [Bacteroidota bacterium]
MMNTFVIKNKIVVRILFFCFLIFYTLGNLDAQIFGSQSLKFSKTLDYIQKYYVDSVDTEELVEKAIVSMLEDLDPHSNYLTAEEVKAMNEPLHGNFEGIGISFNILNDTILVISPISGGPSEKLGIRAGDRIIKIDGENVAGIGITNQDIFDRLRGEKGTRVTVTILRKGYDELLEFQIVRDKIPIFSLDAAYMINKNTGYIKLNRFAATTVDEFEEALKDLREKNLKHLVLDLSGNGGGYMEEAIELADHFLEKNKLIVYTEG